MTSVRMNIDALAAAKTELGTLAEDIETSRTTCLDAIPDTVITSSLWVTRTLGQLPTWLREQKAEPIGIVLDLARLLDTNDNGIATYIGDDTSIEALTDEMATQLATRIDETDDPDELARLTEMLNRHRDSGPVIDTVLEQWGEDGTLANLNKVENANADRPEDSQIDLAGALGPHGQEQVAEWVGTDIESQDADADTVSFLRHMDGQQSFADALYNQVSPQEMADQVQHFNDEVFPDNPGYGGHPDEGALQTYQDSLTFAGGALATHSQGDDDPNALADDWVSAITNDDRKSDSAPLTMLLSAGGQHRAFHPGFIGEVTGQVYEWERDQDGRVWGPRDDDFYNPFDPPTVQHTHSGSSQWGDRNSGADGMANLLAALAETPEAAEGFFHGEYGEGTYSLEETMDYFVGGADGRTWDGADGSDEGNGLGLALEAATVGEDERTPEGTEITNKLLENIAEHGGEADDTFDDKWHIGPEMTDSLGNILSGYSPDVYDMLGNIPPASGDTNLDVDQAVLSDVLGELGGSSDGNRTGLETLTTAMLLEGRNRNMDVLEGYEGDHTLLNLPETGYEGQQVTNGDVMGNLLHHGTDMWAGNDDTEQARAEIAAKAIDIAGGFVPGASGVFAEGTSHLVTSTYDVATKEGISAISDAVKNGPSSSAAQYQDVQSDDISDMLQNHAISDLYRADYLGEQGTGQAGGQFDGAPEVLFTGDPPTLLPELSDANGYSLDDTDFSPEKQQEIEDAWRYLNGFEPNGNEQSHNAWNLIQTNSYTGAFEDSFSNPQEMENVE